jgi:Amt family ammonium transporter
MTGFIYPVVVSWVWGGGWLQDELFVDFAGTTCVHLVGGVAGFCAAYMVGPRYGHNGSQIENPEDVKGFREILELYPDQEKHLFRKWFLKRANADVMRPSNVPFIVVGIFMLWVSWLFFNGGSTTSMFSPRHQNAPKIIMNTILAGAPAGLISQYFKHKYV